MLFYCAGKESFGRGNIAMFTQQEINCKSSLTDRTIEIRPLPFDPDVRFVNAPRCTNRSRIATPSLLELWDVLLYPPQDSGVRDIHTALSHHLHQVSRAKFVIDIPTDAENNNRAIEVAATKQRE